jgi:hypothetical protein
MKHVASVVFALAVLAPLSAAAADSAAVLKSLEQAGRSLKTMKADFAETKVLIILNEKQESPGTPDSPAISRRPSRSSAARRRGRPTCSWGSGPARRGSARSTT